MRILVLCHEYPPIGGGGAAVCFALSKQYALAGHEVTVISMGFDNLQDSEIIDEYKLFRIKCGRIRKEMASPLEALIWSQKCWNLVKKLNGQSSFHVGHAHFIMPAGIIASRARKVFGLPFIITSHGSDVPGYNRERLKLVHIIVKSWWKKICASADYIVSPSESLFNLIKKSTTEFKGKVIPNGFEPGRFKPLKKKKKILLCSRLVERKGFQYFLEAIRYMEPNGWDVDIVGDGPMYKALASLGSQCKIPVNMHGWLDNNDPKLKKLYGQAMIFVFPTEWENFSIALLEAMSSGCAVITTDVGGNSEALGDTGCFVKAKDISELRQAILWLTQDFEMCKNLGQRAAERATKLFNWETISERYLKILENLKQ